MSVSKVQASNLRCKNNCGFYGNPSWDGYCSVCYRETYIQQGLSRSIAANITAASAQAFSLFDAKRKQLSGKGANTLKNIFRLNKDSNHEKSLALPEECYIAASEFNSFLATLKASVNADASQMVTKLLDELETTGGSHINQYSVVIQNFYQTVSDRISKSTLYSNVPEMVREQLINAIERFVTTWIYSWAFASPITDDESVDLRLQEKICSLHWVTPNLLDCPINPEIPSEMALLEAATMELMKVNVVYASEDKLEHIVQCCLHVFNALKKHYQIARTQPNRSSSAPVLETFPGPHPKTVSTESGKDISTNADDFLSTLIWVIISANPPLVHSNLQFIMRFANQKRLNSGQAGYFFTNLSCAVHFLTNLTHKSLNMTEQQFYRCMRTGLPFDQKHMHKSEGELTLRDNEFRLLELKEKITELETVKLTTLDKQLQEFDEVSKKEIEKLQGDTRSESVKGKLDPRHIEAPLTLSFNAREKWQTFESVIPAEQQCTNVDSLLGLHDDESTVSLLPKPIQPSPYQSKTTAE